MGRSPIHGNPRSEGEHAPCLGRGVAMCPDLPYCRPDLLARNKVGPSHPESRAALRRSRDSGNITPTETHDNVDGQWTLFSEDGDMDSSAPSARQDVHALTLCLNLPRPDVTSRCCRE